MANFINKYLSQSVYDADSTKQYPNTSLVGNDIVFQPHEEKKVMRKKIVLDFRLFAV